MKTQRTRTVILALLLIAYVSPLCSQAKDKDEFTATDLRIALLLDRLGDAIEARDRAIANGVNAKAACIEEVNRTMGVIDSLNRLSSAKRLIELLEDEVANLQRKGLAPGDPSVQRLSGIIDELKASEKGKAEQAGADQPATKPADKPPVKGEPSTPTPKDGAR